MYTHVYNVRRCVIKVTCICNVYVGDFGDHSARLAEQKEASVRTLIGLDVYRQVVQTSGNMKYKIVVKILYSTTYSG